MLIIPLHVTKLHFIIINLSFCLDLLQINAFYLLVFHNRTSIDNGKLYIRS